MALVRKLIFHIQGINILIAAAQTTAQLSRTAFLEPSIRKYAPQYARRYSHWGVTEILRQEWHDIIKDWKRLRWMWKEREQFTSLAMLA